MAAEEPRIWSPGLSGKESKRLIQRRPHLIHMRKPRTI
jgi:hypothetical protein